MPTTCLLCTDGQLDELGHIIPKLAMRWLKRASKLNSFYFNNDPNVKMQDTPAFKMMCKSCEDKLSAFEKHFTDNHFKKYYRHQLPSEPRDELYIFAISVAWRLIISTERLKATEPQINLYEKIYSDFETRARNFLNDNNYKCNISVYTFSADEILANLPECLIKKSLLLYGLRYGLKAHNFYSKEGHWVISKSHIPTVFFKIGFYFFFVVETGYFNRIQYSMESIRTPSKYELFDIKYTEDFLGFINWLMEGGLYEIDTPHLPPHDYTRRDY